MRYSLAVLFLFCSGCGGPNAPDPEPTPPKQSPQALANNVENVSDLISPLIKLDAGVYSIDVGNQGDRMEFDTATSDAYLSRMVTKEQFGETWPYNADMGVVMTGHNGGITVVFRNSDTMFAVNGLAANSGLPPDDERRTKTGGNARKPATAVIEHAQNGLPILIAFRDYMLEGTGQAEIGSTENADVFRDRIAKLTAP